MEASILEAIRQSNLELRSTLVKFDQQIAKHPRKDQLDRLRADRDKYISGKENAIDAFSSDIHDRINANKPERMKEYILSSLYYTQIRERRSQIHSAHQKTFDWIYKTSDPQDRSFSNFVQWLETPPASHGLYWVSGKPGSGKSTLMRYISEDKRTRDSLTIWAKSKPILDASCFFWLSGTETQKSLNGLLRSLLYDLLMLVPSLISKVAPWRWRAADFGSNLPAWTNSELLEAFQEFVKRAGQAHCLFILIDGLDEYDGDLDQQTELLTFLISLSQSEAVKVCVSSRHYPIFQTTFEGYPTLKLENLTRNDIKVFVEDRLGDLKDFKLLQQIYPLDSAELVSEVVNKAQGVFLWVYLVIRSLRQGVIDGDSMAALTRRLEEIPDDLNEFFQRIINGIPRQQRKYASLYFRIMLVSSVKPLLLALFFVEEEIPDFITKTPLQASHAHIIQAKQRSMERRLESRCRGLLEAQEHVDDSSLGLVHGLQTKYYVDFLHRSVRDFLLSKDTQVTLSEYSLGDFDPNEFLCNSTVAQLKMAESQSVDVPALSKFFLTFARQLERSSGVAHPGLFDTFASLLKHHAPAWPHSSGSYIALALAFSVELYATKMIETESLNLRSEYGHPLILGTRRTLLEYCILDQTSPALVGKLSSARKAPLKFAAIALFEKGADPNESVNGKSIWKSYLDLAASPATAKLDPSWARVARAFIENGAARKAIDRLQYSTKAVAGKRLRYATNEPEDLAILVEMVFKDQGGKEMADMLRENSSTLGLVKRVFARSPRT